MNKAIEIAQKRELWANIKQVDEMWNEDPAFTEEYAKDVYNVNKSDLRFAIESFRQLADQARVISKIALRSVIR